MDLKKIDRIFEETAYIRTGGSDAEKQCAEYLIAQCAELGLKAELYYLNSTGKYALSQCKGKIVMIDGYLGYWMYQDLLENGAVGFITYDGNANYVDEDIDQRELRSYVSKGVKIPGVNINAKNAIKLVKNEAKTAHIILKQDEYKGTSHNVVLEPFEVDMATIKEAKLIVDGAEIPCKGYLCAGSGEVEAELYYLRQTGKYALSQCKG